MAPMEILCQIGRSDTVLVLDCWQTWHSARKRNNPHNMYASSWHDPSTPQCGRASHTFRTYRKVHWPAGVPGTPATQPTNASVVLHRHTPHQTQATLRCLMNSLKNFHLSAMRLEKSSSEINLSTMQRDICQPLLGRLDKRRTTLQFRSLSRICIPVACTVGSGYV